MTEETMAALLVSTKNKLGITTNSRDTRITEKFKSVISELEEIQGLTLDGANPYHFDFIGDYAAWSYEHSWIAGMPRHLQYGLHNLMIQQVARGTTQ